MAALYERIGNKERGNLILHTDWNDLVKEVQSINEMLNKKIDELSAKVDSEMEKMTESVKEVHADLTERIDKLIKENENEHIEMAKAAQELKETVKKLNTDYDDHVQKASQKFLSVEQMIIEMTVIVEENRKFSEKAAPVINMYRKLTLRTTKARYAMGEMAELIATVTDLFGNPIPANETPWVDFIGTWGQIKPVSGFLSRAGAGERSVSVRCNNGIARVLVRADHVANLTSEAENDVAATLGTSITVNGAAKKIADVFLDAITPMEAKLNGSFSAMSVQFSQPAAKSMQKFVDTFYMGSIASVSSAATELVTQTWRDYRSTIIAMVIPDGDPLTPDQSLGSSSIQVTFRDWISPWLATDFFVDFGLSVDSLYETIKGVIDDDDYILSSKNIGKVIEDSINGKGPVITQRGYQVARKVLDRVKGQGSSPVVRDLADSMKDAVEVQMSMERAKDPYIEDSGKRSGLNAITGANSRVYGQTTGMKAEIDSVKGEIEGVKSKTSEVHSKVSSMEKSVGQIDGRVYELDNYKSKVDSVEQLVQVLNNFSVVDVTSKLQSVKSMELDISSIKKQLSL